MALKTLFSISTSMIVKNLFDPKKSEFLDFLKITNQKLDKINENYKNSPIVFDVFLQQLSLVIDEKVIEHRKENDLKPVAGKLCLKKNTEDDNIIAEWEFYFIDQNKKFHKIWSSKVFNKEIFYLDDYKKIISGLNFDIDSPF